MTSVDSSVIFAALAQREAHHTLAVGLLRDAGADGPLFISPVVYAELMASRRPAAVLDFLAMARISVAWTMPSEVWELAASVLRGSFHPTAVAVAMKPAGSLLRLADARHKGLCIMIWSFVRRKMWRCRETGGSNANAVPPWRVPALAR